MHIIPAQWLSCVAQRAGAGPVSLRYWTKQNAHNRPKFRLKNGYGHVFQSQTVEKT